MREFSCRPNPVWWLVPALMLSACTATPSPEPTTPATGTSRAVASVTVGGLHASATPAPEAPEETIAGLPPTPSPVALPPEGYPPPEPGAFGAYPGPDDVRPSATLPPELASETAVAVERAATATALMAGATPTAARVSGGDLVFAGGLLRLTLPSGWQAAPDAAGALVTNGDLSAPDPFRTTTGLGPTQSVMRLDVLLLVAGRSPETVEADWVAQAEADLRANQQLEGPYHFQVSTWIGHAYVAPLQALGRPDRVLTAFLNLGDGWLLVARILPYDGPGYTNALGVLSTLVRNPSP